MNITNEHDIFEKENLVQDCKKLHNVIDIRSKLSTKFISKFLLNLLDGFIGWYQKKYGELSMETINVLYKFVDYAEENSDKV